MVNLLDNFKFSQENASEWVGLWPTIQRTFALFTAKYLQACFAATLRRTPEHPSGQVMIHPAIKLLTGDAAITASRAADLIKRLLGPIEDELSGLLKEGYEIAIRLRPKSPKKKR